ncbi:hypothetical protein L083_6933 [Actinoplanes sp. N902-109]|nr:hypothetical protein L083_6933 [Actinoplanes sp. N902-109]
MLGLLVDGLGSQPRAGSVLTREESSVDATAARSHRRHGCLGCPGRGGHTVHHCPSEMNGK